MKHTILLSIITPTLNNEKDLGKLLKSIRRQNFSKNRLEIIISDGGSKDNTLEIARKYKVKIINNPDIFPDPGVNRGIKIARGELIMVLASDNIFKSNIALNQMTKVFEDKDIFAVFPKHATSKADTIYTNYINTFTDPASHFVYGYASNPRTFNKIYRLIDKNKDYILFNYKTNSLVPMISFAQGFTFRKGFQRSKQNEFDDISPVIELIKENKKIAYMYSVELYHHTVNNLSHFIKKQASKTRNYLNRKNFGIFHRARLLSQKQTERIRIWPLYSLTIFPPILYAFYHLIKDREKMWIFHPFLCIISGYTSFFTLIGFYLSKNINEIFRSR